jgi:hypothetical protein
MHHICLLNQRNSKWPRSRSCGKARRNQEVQPEGSLEANGNSMTEKQLRDFAKTKRKKLPTKKK